MPKERYTANGVVARGYEIYDGWRQHTYRSRKIVSAVQAAVDAAADRESMALYVEALAHLFALDLRIETHYNTLIKCIFRYISWRRETGAMKRLKGLLRMPDGYDVCSFIELELMRMREEINTDERSTSDRKPRGGKVTAFEGIEETARAVDQPSEAPEESIAREKGATAEEKDEEIPEVSEAQPSNEAVPDGERKTTDEIREIVEAVVESAAAVLIDKKIEIRSEDQSVSQKVESIGVVKETKPLENNPPVRQENQGVIDIPPPIEETVEKTAPEKISFIDEVIMDNFIKGGSDVIAQRPIENVSRPTEMSQPTIPEHNGKEPQGDGKDIGFLYDKMLRGDREVPRQGQNGTPEDLRIPIKVDDSNSPENQHMSDIDERYYKKLVTSQKILMEQELKKELAAAGEEAGIHAPVRIVGESHFEDLIRLENASIRKH